MIQFVLVTQKHTKQTLKSDTQVNDSYDPIIFSESKIYNINTEVWYPSEWLVWSSSF